MYLCVYLSIYLFMHVSISSLYIYSPMHLCVIVEGGTYIIEDIETSYWTKGGLYGYETRYGYHHQNSLIEVFKDLLDDINRYLSNQYLSINQSNHYLLSLASFYISNHYLSI
jgi:hypothetical protein